MKHVSHHYPARTQQVSPDTQKRKRTGTPVVKRTRNVREPFPGKSRVIVTDRGSPA